MNKVNILPADVIAKIAAGEAVGQASVVKELLENAIDAGASSIEVHLKDAGKELIHIRDNGSGITPADLEKIFQRHATSKIAVIEDLEKLHSMGFRGEALYSIAAVSDVNLSSRTLMDEGWQIHIRGGIRQNFEPTPLPGKGTDIKIAELFFNTPARRKFLKNNASELHQIINVVLPYALIYPEKRFILTHAGRTLLDLSFAPSRLDRAAAALNVPMNHLLETEQEFIEERIRIRMILGNINVQRPRRDLQFIFINNRPVESKNLSFNLNDVYKLILPPGVYGAFIVDIHVDPANVDVNIHPTKREVRIKDEGMLIRLLRRMVEYQLMHKGAAKEFSSSSPLVGGIIKDTYQTSLPLVGRPVPPKAGAREGGINGTHLYLHPHLTSPIKGEENMQEFQLFGEENTLRSKFTRARFIGSFLQKFLLFEADQSLLIVDQHAAQERIMFEKFKDQMDKAQVESQPLLTPLLLKLTPQERIAWEELQEKLTRAGIETTQFDDDTIAIQTQPLLLKNIEPVVRTLLAGDEAPRMDHSALARRACKASIVAGTGLIQAKLTTNAANYLNAKTPSPAPTAALPLSKSPKASLTANS